MRVFTRLGLILALASAGALAQRQGGGMGAGGGMRGGMGPVRGGGMHGGFGGIGRPGVGAGHVGGGISVGVRTGRFFGGLGSGFRGFGVRPHFGSRGFYGGLGLYGWPLMYPYWPMFTDYAYPAYAPYSYSPGPNVTVVYPEAAPAAAPVYVLERARPIMRDYSQGGYGTLPPDSQAQVTRPDEETIYLVAFKDQLIRPAVAYWVEGRTLHYVSLRHERKEAPLDSVDRDLSLQLNRERRVPFRLPE